ncbi:hypothetical protein PIB30_087528 [Stylosanthes scabra]|uniref:Uncharacterized protein n=1 Tax=Stylosanthes scabra TaxID=79078 RepID=A0ABU6WRT9_9FABA|nr:hypothetical protein [Stylosanthes scabra]
MFLAFAFLFSSSTISATHLYFLSNTFFSVPLISVVQVLKEELGLDEVLNSPESDRCRRAITADGCGTNRSATDSKVSSKRLKQSESSNEEGKVRVLVGTIIEKASSKNNGSHGDGDDGDEKVLV